MNRIILIGNGFDLAHGLKTSYRDFIDDYWRNTTIDVEEKLKLSFLFENEEIEIKKTNDINSPYAKINFEEKNYQCFTKNINSVINQVRFKNAFLKTISDKNSIENWVDIENEYYSLLKNSFSKNPSPYYLVSDLNKDFERIKNLLKEYLKRIESEFELKDRILYLDFLNKIYSPYKLEDCTESFKNKKTQTEYDRYENVIKNVSEEKLFIDNIDDEDNKTFLRIICSGNSKHEIREFLLKGKFEKILHLMPENILFFSFNYTNTHKKYESFKDSTSGKLFIAETIQMHGSIYDKSNPIIFGFGDEIDDNYKSIENLNDNRYLENIKSIKYLETDNYKKLLQFINSDEYQIFIFGHSCGISDRTLLNTLFEHPNCVSIKPFFYKISDTEDNFSDIIRNISRHFNNKAVMRDKVVNKKFCNPLS